MKVLDVTDSWRDGTATVRVRLRPLRAGGELELWFRFDGLDAPLEGIAPALTVALTVPAMHEGEPVEIPASLPAPLVANIAKAQQVLASWYRDLTPVPVSAARIEPGPVISPAADSNGGRSVACCFSGGVDSWYSLLNHRARIERLLLVRGFDIGLSNDLLWDRTVQRAARVADGFGVGLVTCATNLRDVLDKSRTTWGRRFAGDFWGGYLHGAALAAIGLMMRRTTGELIVPATHSYAQIRPWGSSPLLDPLWSDGHVSVTHDGCEADRVGKVRAISDSALALATLRVCHHDTGEFNCGHCEKCLRTMMALRACGALVRAETFPHHLPARDIHSLVVPPHVRHHYEALQVEAYRVGDVELARAAEVVLNQRMSLRQTLARAKRALRGSALGRGLRGLVQPRPSAASVSLTAHARR